MDYINIVDQQIRDFDTAGDVGDAGEVSEGKAIRRKNT